MGSRCDRDREAILIAKTTVPGGFPTHADPRTELQARYEACCAEGILVTRIERLMP